MFIVIDRSFTSTINIIYWWSWINVRWNWDNSDSHIQCSTFILAKNNTTDIYNLSATNSLSTSIFISIQLSYQRNNKYRSWGFAHFSKSSLILQEHTIPFDDSRSPSFRLVIKRPYDVSNTKKYDENLGLCEVILFIVYLFCFMLHDSFHEELKVPIDHLKKHQLLFKIVCKIPWQNYNAQEHGTVFS